jgi:hypothetical protein
LDELDEAGEKAAGEAGNRPTHGQPDRGHDPDRLVEAKGFPHDKGSS